MTIAAATNESIANRLKEPYFIDYEYDVSANNFKAEIHTYYPIPMSEKMSNLKYKQ